MIELDRTVVIKRPLAWLLVSYLTGSLCAWDVVVICLLLSVFLIAVSVFFFYHSRFKGRRLPAINTRPVLSRTARVGGRPIHAEAACLALAAFLGYFMMHLSLAPMSTEMAPRGASEAYLVGEVESISGKPGSYKVILFGAMLELSDGSIYDPTKILVYLDDLNGLHHGNVASFKGDFKSLERAGNPGQFDQYSYYKARKVEGMFYADTCEISGSRTDWISYGLYLIRERFIETFREMFPEKEMGIITAMLLGEKSYLTADIRELYQQNGIAHILAISGLHVTVLGMGLFSLLRRIRLPLWTAVLSSGFLLIFYGVLTGFNVSAIRAITMFVVSVSSKLLGRTYDSGSALSLAGLIVLIDSPLMLFDTGCQLSFLAVVGIIIVSPCLTHICPDSANLRVKKAWSALSSSLGIQLATLPVILWNYYEIPVYSVFINLIILPCMGVLMLLICMCGFAGVIFLPAGCFISASVSSLLRFYELLCSLFEKLPYHMINTGKPNVIQVAIYVAALAAFLLIVEHRSDKANSSINLKGRVRLARNQRTIWKGILLLPCLFLIVKLPRYGITATFLDVGQGDGIVIECNGINMMVDGGSSDIKNLGRYRILPYLKHQGIKRLDYCFITHADIDHYSGAEELLRLIPSQIDICCLLLPDIREPDDAYSGLLTLAEEKGVKVVRLGEGDRLAADKLTISCLHPEHGQEQVKDRNNTSLVLDLEYDEFKMLLTGDIQSDEEERIIFTDNGTAYNIVKIPHHGAANATSEILIKKLLRMETAIISCGYKNRYGHPSNETLERLKNKEAAVLRTDLDGAVSINTNGRIYKIVTMYGN